MNEVKYVIYRLFKEDSEIQETERFNIQNQTYKNMKTVNPMFEDAIRNYESKLLLNK